MSLKQSANQKQKFSKRILKVSGTHIPLSQIKDIIRSKDPSSAIIKTAVLWSLSTDQSIQYSKKYIDS